MRKNGSSASFDDFLRIIADDGQYRLYNNNERSVRARYIKNGGVIAHLQKTQVRTIKQRLTTAERRKMKDEIVDKTLEIINGSTSSSVMIGELYSKLKAIVPDSCRNKTQVIRRALHNDSRIRFEGPVKSTVVKLAK